MMCDLKNKRKKERKFGHDWCHEDYSAYFSTVIAKHLEAATYYTAFDEVTKENTE